MMQYIISFIVFGVIFALADAVWLTAMKGFYKKELKSLLRPRTNIAAAIMCYVVYVIGAVVFVVVPSFAEGCAWWHILPLGALFGLVAYAMYDLTNAATLKKWPARLAAVDMLWGAVATSLVSLATYAIVLWWG